MKGMFFVVMSILVLAGVAGGITELDYIDVPRALVLITWAVAGAAMGILGSIYIHEGKSDAKQ